MLSCKDLKQLPSLVHIKYIAGFDHLDNVIRWPYITETVTITPWVHGGELLIISGAVSNKKNFSLIKMIEEAVENKLAGVLLLIGEHYVDEKEVTKDLIDLANNASFPVMTIPWNVPLVDIMEDIGSSVIHFSSRGKSNVDVIHSIIFNENIQEEALASQCSFVGYDVRPRQQMMLLQFYSSSTRDKSKNSNIINPSKIQHIYEIISNTLNDNHIPHMISNHSNNLVVLFHAQTEQGTLERIIGALIGQFTQEYPSIHYNIGVGKAYPKIPSVKNSFREASRCVQLLNKTGLVNQVYYYENLGLYRLFFELEKEDILSSYVEQILGKIIEYDKQNHTFLLNSLQCYLQHNCNIVQAANKLFIHRNTLKYRIDRIEEITNRSLSDSYARLDFQNALLAKRVLE